MDAKPPALSPDEQRFWKHVRRDGGDRCWLWLGERRRDGGCRFTRGNGTSITARRMAYELVLGEIPEGWHVITSCRQPYCVNPDHLELTDLIGDGLHQEPDLVDIFERNERRFRAGQWGD